MQAHQHLKTFGISWAAILKVPVPTKPDFDVEVYIWDKRQPGVWLGLVKKHGGDRGAWERFTTLSFFGWILKYSPGLRISAWPKLRGRLGGRDSMISLGFEADL
jgi:hypothetical protein